MLRVFRLRAWCLATVLCVAASTLGTSLEVLLHADSAHADACVAPVQAHDASTHRFTAPDDSGSDSHCLACHSARSLRLHVEPAALAARSDDMRLLSTAPVDGFVPAPARSLLPSRSPPRLG
jgi:hypothetical protein